MRIVEQNTGPGFLALLIPDNGAWLLKESKRQWLWGRKKIAGGRLNDPPNEMTNSHDLSEG